MLPALLLAAPAQPSEAQKREATAQRRRGHMLLNNPVISIDGDKVQSWVYLTGQRRVRKLPNACCDTPTPASAVTRVPASGVNSKWIRSPFFAASAGISLPALAAKAAMRAAAAQRSGSTRFSSFLGGEPVAMELPNSDDTVLPMS